MPLPRVVWNIWGWQGRNSGAGPICGFAERSGGLRKGAARGAIVKRDRLIFNLSAALYGEITFDDGEVQELNFDDYPLVHLPDSPEAEVHIVPLDTAPSGAVEPWAPPIAPAVVGNAVCDATGKWIRRLPRTPKRIRGNWVTKFPRIVPDVPQPEGRIFNPECAGVTVAKRLHMCLDLDPELTTAGRVPRCARAVGGVFDGGG